MHAVRWESKLTLMRQVGAQKGSEKMKGRRARVHPDTVRLAALRALLAHALDAGCAPLALEGKQSVVAALLAGADANEIMRKHDLTCERVTGALVRLTQHGS